MENLLTSLLKNSAALYPQNEAVRMNGKAMTYAELDQATNRVARALQSLGVRRGDRVGIFVHKSTVSVVSAFGIMKAGAAYVPLDPNAPAARLAYITRNCDARVILTTSDKLESLSQFFTEGTAIETVVLVDDQPGAGADLPEAVRLLRWEAVEAEDDGPVPADGLIDTDLAYILYTSGSTGVPKGVMINHRTILTFINWSCERFRMTSQDRVTSHAPLHFDLSTFDIYATVKAGGTIVPVDESLSALPARLAAFLAGERITITYMVPSILSFMVNYGKLGAHDFSHLRTILFAGEVFPLKYLRKLVEAIPHAEYYNLYGPTETNVCTYYQVKPADLAPERTEAVPIGKACENIEVFALAEDGTPITEAGREGELWVRGTCVAQGYWGDAQKTADAFKQDPRNDLYSDVTYRTGDLVELAPDGENWYYVGRRDHMIKSRGYRIELGEIENALYRHQEVKEAAAVAIPDEMLGNRIRAFVVLSHSNGDTPKELRAFCARHLPKYMIPEDIVACESIPKTSSGKIDRPALVTRAHGSPAN